MFSTWTNAEPVTLNGIEGPNDGWLVVIAAGLACLWVRMMSRTGWAGAVGVLGVLGASIVICWTAVESWVDNRRVLDASVGHGLLLVLAAGLVLGATAAVRGVELLRNRPTPARRSPA